MAELRCFNPLPLPKQGEIPDHVEIYNLSGFQSAPLTEARGDVFAACGTTLTVTVSIRSPYRSKGRLDGLQAVRDVARVSIRSPYRSKGR